MTIAEILGVEKGRHMISIAGGGGKTATMFNLAKALPDSTLMLTTTTKIMKPAPSPDYAVLEGRDSLSFLKEFKKAGWAKHAVVGVSSREYPGKLTGCSMDFISEVSGDFDTVIIEADGSAGRPVKAPASHEPVIHPLTDIYIGVIGLDCLGRTGDDGTVHRPERFARIRGREIGDPISRHDLIRLINHEEGLFKNAPEGCRRVVLLNKGDLLDEDERNDLADSISNSVIFPHTLILNSYLNDQSVMRYRR